MENAKRYCEQETTIIRGNNISFIPVPFRSLSANSIWVGPRHVQSFEYFIDSDN